MPLKSTDSSRGINATDQVSIAETDLSSNNASDGLAFERTKCSCAGATEGDNNNSGAQRCCNANPDESEDSGDEDNKATDDDKEEDSPYSGKRDNYNHRHGAVSQRHHNGDSINLEESDDEDNQDNEGAAAEDNDASKDVGDEGIDNDNVPQNGTVKTNRRQRDRFPAFPFETPSSSARAPVSFLLLLQSCGLLVLDNSQQRRSTDRYMQSSGEGTAI